MTFMFIYAIIRKHKGADMNSVQSRLVKMGTAKSLKDANSIIQDVMIAMTEQLIQSGAVQMGGYLNLKMEVSKGGKEIIMPNKTRVISKTKTIAKIRAGKRLLRKIQ